MNITTEQALWIAVGLLTLGYLLTILAYRRVIKGEQEQTRVWRNRALAESERVGLWRSLYIRQGKALREERTKGLTHFTVHEDGTYTQHLALSPDEWPVPDSWIAVMQDHFMRRGL